MRFRDETSLVVTLLLLFQSGCVVEDAERACEPGRQTACACPTGASGSQRCSDDGSYWAPCQCSEPGDGDGDLDADADLDQEGPDALDADGDEPIVCTAEELEYTTASDHVGWKVCPDPDVDADAPCPCGPDNSFIMNPEEVAVYQEPMWDDGSGGLVHLLFLADYGTNYCHYDYSDIHASVSVEDGVLRVSVSGPYFYVDEMDWHLGCDEIGQMRICYDVALDLCGEHCVPGTYQLGMFGGRELQIECPNGVGGEPIEHVEPPTGCRFPSFECADLGCVSCSQSPCWCCRWDAGTNWCGTSYEDALDFCASGGIRTCS